MVVVGLEQKTEDMNSVNADSGHNMKKRMSNVNSVSMKVSRNNSDLPKCQTKIPDNNGRLGTYVTLHLEPRYSTYSLLFANHIIVASAGFSDYPMLTSPGKMV